MVLPMNKNLLKSAFAISMALGLVTARSIWPDHIVEIQMFFLTVFVVVLGLVAIWRDRGNSRFPVAVALLFASHALVLFLARSMFPFGSIITFLAFAVLEVAAISLSTLHVLLR